MERPEDIPVLASWGRRLVAYLIDNLVLLLANVPAGATIVARLAQTPDNKGLFALRAGLFLLSALVAPAGYFTMLHRRSRQTLGKRWLPLRAGAAAARG